MPAGPAAAKALFLEAVAIDDPAARDALVGERCGGDAELRARVHALLAANDRALAGEGTASFEAAGGGEAADPTADYPRRGEHAGAVVAGRYKLVEQLGEGGMGSVWMAQQTEPVRRLVAIKLVKAGMDSRQVLARFEAERQALALMDHPSIARVLDAGTTDAGRPFFVMELVKGVPVTRYCDDRKLTPRERLGLFVQVCQAVQHAHQKGVIHRDLKPSNVLVAEYDGKPVPKVIDFGVAKAAGQPLTDKTLVTGFGAVVGTPEYMSPEQATFNQLDADTRSDVYSLGVLLYELLTGCTPLDRRGLGRAALLEVLRLVREAEAPRPSARLSTLDTLPRVAADRGTEPAKLSRLLRGDLDWVVLKALEKDRTRRYETAAALAADLLRHLADEPVAARPPSPGYRLRKAWRRNRPAFLAAGAVAASLLVGTGVSVTQAVRADREARRVAAALDELRATAPAFAEQARALAARERYDEAVEKLDYAARLRPDEPDYPLARADLLRCQFRFAEAAAAYRATLALRPGDARAAAAAELCDELQAAPRGPDGRPGREDLGRLYAAMQKEQRPAAELMPVARLLGEEKTHLAALWLDRLKELPVSGERPLAKRLTVRDDGRLALDLGDTKVADLSPLAGMPLAWLNLERAGQVTDVGPLRGMRLQTLDLTGTKVSDLGPLAGMTSLERLVLAESLVTDLGPVRGLPLKHLSLHNTRVTDLTPLAGMPLRSIDLTNAPVLDFAPLAGMPLEKLTLQHNRVTDLGFVRGMPLRELSLWGCADARNYQALTGLAALELLILPRNYRELPADEVAAIGRLRSLPRLRQLGAEITDRMPIAATGPSDRFWKAWDEDEARFGPLRRAGVKFRLVHNDDATYSVLVDDQPGLTNLAVLDGLKGFPLRELYLNGCGVSDLSPLRGLSVRVLGLHGNPVTDLRPLRDLPLRELSLDWTPVADLAPLAGMELRKLYLHGCGKLAEVAVLGGLPTLELVTVPPQARGVERLRALPNLKRIGYDMQPAAPFLPVTSAAEFWAAYEATAALPGRLADLGIKPKRVRPLPDGTLDVDLSESPLADLSVLAGVPVSELWVWDTKVADLAPLRGMKLRKLQLLRTRVTDLRPLAGMALEYLNLTSTAVTDISPLAGMPLEDLKLHDCKALTDVSPLKRCPALRWLTLPRGARDIEFLRGRPSLERLSYEEDDRNGYRPTLTAAEFWAAYDAGK